jgi:SNF2 family DNA or RNA helicase
MQIKLYDHFTHQNQVSDVLGTIQNVKRILTHPDMIIQNIQNRKDNDNINDELPPEKQRNLATYSSLSDTWKESEELFDEDYEEFDTKLSHKMFFLSKILEKCKKVKDKIVIVSNFTTILDYIQSILLRENYKFSRLDGTVQTKKRQDILGNNYNSL